MTTELRSGTSTAPLVPAALGVAAQLAYPLTSGVVRDLLTVSIVVLLAASCLVHAAVSRGAVVAWTVLAVTAVPAFVAEVVGVRTGVPFGSYEYTGSLGPRLLEVPLVVALAWTMLAWPAALAARALARGFAARVVIGAWALSAADLFLDPQLVAAGQWRWTHPDPHLPGVAMVPLTNLAGWVVVSVVLSLLLQWVLDRAGDADDRLPIALYIWLWAGWTVALAVFLDLPAAAGWGALGMGIVAVPLVARRR